MGSSRGDRDELGCAVRGRMTAGNARTLVLATKVVFLGTLVVGFTAYFVEDAREPEDEDAHPGRRVSVDAPPYAACRRPHNDVGLNGPSRQT